MADIFLMTCLEQALPQPVRPLQLERLLFVSGSPWVQGIVCWSKIAVASRRHFIARARSASEDISAHRIMFPVSTS
jgi:hypothetical protein